MLLVNDFHHSSAFEDKYFKSALTKLYALFSLKLLYQYVMYSLNRFQQLNHIVGRKYIEGPGSATIK